MVCFWDFGCPEHHRTQRAEMRETHMIIPRTPGRARAKPARALVGGALKRDRPKSQSVVLSVGHAHVTIALRPITHKGAFMTSHSL